MGRGILAELADTLGRHLAHLAPGDSTVTQLTPPGLNAWAPAASPDGASIAYVSDISGVAAVYARRFDGSGEAILVSADGGTDPHWTGDGRAIVYRNGARIMRADPRAGPALELAGRPRQLFEAAFDFSQAGNWDLSRDGRFVFVRSDPATVGRLLVVTGWFDEIGQ
jgi:dipeptidyl aminopeptidase/acylaminoacyl peptidase